MALGAGGMIVNPHTPLSLLFGTSHHCLMNVDQNVIETRVSPGI